MHALTEQQNVFVAELVATGCSPTEAARRAGYAYPAQEAYRLIRNPAVMAFIRSERERLIEGELSGLALGTLRDILTDDGAPVAVKIKAASLVLTLAGWLGRPAGRDAPVEKQLQEMTESELRALATALRGDAQKANTAEAHDLPSGHFPTIADGVVLSLAHEGTKGVSTDVS